MSSPSLSISEAPTPGIGNLIADNRFFVPTHQRDYKWDRDSVQKFFDDLIAARDRTDRYYFIGLMVFMREDDGRLRVLDGQQRLATAIIMFSALRAWFAIVGAPAETAHNLQYDFIGRADYGETSPRPKLSLNLNNDETFQEFVVRGSPLHLIREKLRRTNKNNSTFPLLDAIVYIHDRVAQLAEEKAAEAITYFSTLIKFMRDNVIVVRLTVPNESNAFKVFETLNDRGMDLSAIDLVKNHIFGLAYQEGLPTLHQLELRWNQLSDTLKESKQEDFLKTYWISRHGLAYSGDIFDSVKDNCKTPEQAKAISQDMLEAAEHFAAMDSADDVVWRPHSDRTRELVSDLRILGTKLVGPVVLSAIKRFSSGEFEKLLWLLQTIIVRWQVVRGGRPGVIERTCARLAHAIWNKEVATAKDGLSYLTEPYGTDSEFRENLEKFENSTEKRTALILRTIESHERQQKKGQAGIELKPAKLTIEHILPRNPGAEWSAVIQSDANIVAECVEKLGNLCLVNEARNRELGRRGFAKKKVTFSESDLITTKKLSESAGWTRMQIEHRQAYLAKRAADIWKFS